MKGQAKYTAVGQPKDWQYQEATSHPMKGHLTTARFWKGSEREQEYVLTAGILKEVDSKGTEVYPK